MWRKKWWLLIAVVMVGCSGEKPEHNTRVSQASHPEVSLSGSNFEIDTDANLKLDDPAPSKDWASVTEDRKTDLATGQTDDSFGQGTKEDTAVPSVVSGQIPNNKSDLLTFGVYQEVTSATFVHMFWHRVQEPTGTTNMDFEFNQSRTLSANNKTPIRTAGDLLIQYDLAQGGVNPILSLSTWLTTAPPGCGGPQEPSCCEAGNTLPCWSPKIALNGAEAGTPKAAGSINTSAIPAADSDGLATGDGSVSPRTFGEASVNFTEALQNVTGCTTFGSVYLKSRASDSFTAAVKDFIAPVDVNITTCGSVSIIKTDDAGNALNGAQFSLYTDNAPVGGTRGAEDTLTNPELKCTTAGSGTCTIINVPFGEYWVVETSTPAGYGTAADQHVSVTSTTPNPTALTFVDPRLRGAIKITKVAKHASADGGSMPLAGVDFTVNGETKTTDANGIVCFDNLLFGNYTVHEVTEPGYAAVDDTTVTVDNAATCAGSPYAGEAITVNNTPLTNITCSAASQVTGATRSHISCTGPGGAIAPDPADSTPDAYDDISETYKNLVPGTYTCTLVIDP